MHTVFVFLLKALELSRKNRSLYPRIKTVKILTTRFHYKLKMEYNHCEFEDKFSKHSVFNAFSDKNLVKTFSERQVKCTEK